MKFELLQKHVDVRQVAFKLHPQRMRTGFMPFVPEVGCALLLYYVGQQGRQKIFRTSEITKVEVMCTVYDSEDVSKPLGHVYRVETLNSTYKVVPAIPAHWCLR